MVYAFKYSLRGKPFYFLWDIESGSLHMADYPAYLVCGNKNNKLNEEERRDYNSLDGAQISEISEELISLEQSGLINMPAPDYHGIMKRSEIKALCLHICHDCNLRCSYCFGNEGTYNTERDYMSAEVGKKAIDFLIERSGNRRSLEVDFFGGEPLMNMDAVREILHYAEKRGAEEGKEFSFTITTNALLLNDENIDFINRKMYNVVISIDGRKDIHNCVRKTRNGNDAYDVILSNALKFRKIRGDKQYYIRGTFTGLNPDFYKDVLYLNDLGFDQLSIEPVVLPENHPLAIKKEQIPEVLESYVKLADEYIERRKSPEKWFNFFHFMLDLENGPCVTKRLTGCGAGAEYLAISPIGDIYPCHQFVGKDGFKMGSVNDGSFDGSIQSRFRAISVQNKERCHDCVAKYFCSGGCIANSFNYEHDLTKPYEAGCEMMRKRFELSLAIYAIENYEF
jgi:uncharacterized protein